VCPYADHEATASSAAHGVPFVSTAPTEITNGSLPGEYWIFTGWPATP
jgi:hypothetical protein